MVHTFVPKWPSLRIKQVVYSIATVLLDLPILRPYSVSTKYSIPLYNAMLINGKNDDIGAIINTATNEYNALMYIVGAVVLSAAPLLVPRLVSWRGVQKI